jgi:hypothetical protein
MSIGVRVRKPRSTGPHILTVGVEDRAVQTLAAAGSHGGVQGIGHQASVVMSAHRPAQQVPGGQVDDRGQAQPGLVGRNTGHIATPGHIRPVGVEQPPQQVPGGAAAVSGRVKLQRQRGR